MLNKQIDLGDAEGDGHQIALTLFDTGSLVIASFNPDSGHSDQVVMLPQQWRAAMKMLIDSYGTAACPYFEQPDRCRAHCDQDACRR